MTVTNERSSTVRGATYGIAAAMLFGLSAPVQRPCGFILVLETLVATDTPWIQPTTTTASRCR